jgi:SAM-dependent methyltransferase
MLRKLKQQFVRIAFNKDLEDSFISNDFGFGRGKPVDRFYIESFIKQHTDKILGSCLEFGDTTYIDLFGKSVKDKYSFNYSSEPSQYKNNIMGDLTKIDTLSKNSFDCILCINVLNFIYDLPIAVEGLKKLIKPNGKIIITLAGVSSHISRYDMDRWGDYWRFTNKSAIKLFKDAGFHVEKIQTYGNPYACSAQINGYSMEDLSKEKIVKSDPDYQLLIACILSKYSS